MTVEPRDAISEITEINGRASAGFRAFCASMGWGTLAGTLALMGLFAPFQQTLSIDALAGPLATFGFLVGVFNLLGMTVFGLPVTRLLRAIGAEWLWLYTILGAIIGFTAMALMFEVWRLYRPEALIIPGSAAIAGAASAFRWGHWRTNISRKAECTTPRDNPFHDMIY